VIATIVCGGFTNGIGTIRNRAACIERAQHPAPTLVEDVCIDHRGRYVRMAKQFLNCADVVAAVE
jgi:hypothetical protein